MAARARHAHVSTFEISTLSRQTEPQMADRNRWGFPGNGILSGLALGVPASDPEQQPQGILSGYFETAPYGAVQRSIEGGSAASGTWPSVGPSPTLGAARDPFMISAPSALQISPDSPSKFMPARPMQDTNARRVAASPQIGWPPGPTLDHEGPPTAALPASYQDSEGRRTWWAPQ